MGAGSSPGKKPRKTQHRWSRYQLAPSDRAPGSSDAAEKCKWCPVHIHYLRQSGAEPLMEWKREGDAQWTPGPPPECDRSSRK